MLACTSCMHSKHELLPHSCKEDVSKFEDLRNNWKYRGRYYSCTKHFCRWHSFLGYFNAKICLCVSAPRFSRPSKLIEFLNGTFIHAKHFWTTKSGGNVHGGQRRRKTGQEIGRPKRLCRPFFSCPAFRPRWPSWTSSNSPNSLHLPVEMFILVKHCRAKNKTAIFETRHQYMWHLHSSYD